LDFTAVQDLRSAVSEAIAEEVGRTIGVCRNRRTSWFGLLKHVWRLRSRAAAYQSARKRSQEKLEEFARVASGESTTRHNLVKSFNELIDRQVTDASKACKSLTAQMEPAVTFYRSLARVLTSELVDTALFQAGLLAVTGLLGCLASQLAYLPVISDKRVVAVILAVLIRAIAQLAVKRQANVWARDRRARSLWAIRRLYHAALHDSAPGRPSGRSARRRAWAGI
jgi:hypothetical protein